MELYKADRALSLDELSLATGIEKNALYQALYDLAFRKIWTPHPVTRLEDKKYVLTTVGRLVMRRYFKKYVRGE